MPLALTYQDVINIHTAVAPAGLGAPAPVLKTMAGHGANGSALLRNAVTNASAEGTTANRTALLALLIQCNQPFSDGNTRVATAVIYAEPILERSQWVRARAYQTYGQIGHSGPQYTGNPAPTLAGLAWWINARMVGVPDPTGRWNQILLDIAAVQNQVAAMRAALPLVPSQLRSWFRNLGY